MGGTVAMLAAQGHRVTILDVTDGEPTPFGDHDTRMLEAAQAARELSAPGNPIARLNLGLTNRRVVHTLEARHALAGVIRACGAQLMFVPYFEDAHPDHLAVTRIAQDARFDAKLSKQPMPGDGGAEPRYPAWLFHYYATHLRIVPAPTFIVDTSDFAAQKMRSMACYKSQFEHNPANRGLPARLATADAYFGSRINAAAGEPFFSREPLAVREFGGLFAGV